MLFYILEHLLLQLGLCILWTQIISFLGKNRYLYGYLCCNFELGQESSSSFDYLRIDSDNDWESNGTWESNSPSEESCLSLTEIFDWKFDCLQSNRIELAFCDDEKWRLLSLATTLINWIVLPSNSINYYVKGKSQKTRSFCKYVWDTKIKLYNDHHAYNLYVV